MGQQSLQIKNRVQVLEKVQKELLENADNKYMKDHFLVGENVNMDKIKHNLLIDYALCTTNCEVIDWVWYKINGVLLNEKKFKFDLKPQQTYVYNITEYIKEDSTWNDIQW